MEIKDSTIHLNRTLVINHGDDWWEIQFTTAMSLRYTYPKR